MILIRPEHFLERTRHKIGQFFSSTSKWSSKKVHYRLNYIYMSVRNKHIRSIVCENHARRFPERPLEVFFVSNRQYKTNRNRTRTQEFTMQGSGIPALRSHCHKIPARAQFRIACHFLTVRLKDLVQKVHLWLNGGSKETIPNDQTVQRLLHTLNNDLQLVGHSSPY